jgi:hypothetical protein
VTVRRRATKQNEQNAVSVGFGRFPWFSFFYQGKGDKLTETPSRVSVSSLVVAPCIAPRRGREEKHAVSVSFGRFRGFQL